MSDTPIWERVPGESSKAYQAFEHYLMFPPSERSLDKAYTSTLKLGSEPHRAPGTWTEWSRKYGWVERAGAYDDHLAAERRRVKEAKMRELEEQRWNFELGHQTRLEELVQLMTKVAHAAGKTFIGEIEAPPEVDEDGNVKPKKINLSGYGRFIDSLRETATQAICGVRPPVKETEDAEALPMVRGEFAWVPPTEEAVPASDEK